MSPCSIFVRFPHRMHTYLEKSLKMATSFFLSATCILAIIFRLVVFRPSSLAKSLELQWAAWGAQAEEEGVAWGPGSQHPVESCAWADSRCTGICALGQGLGVPQGGCEVAVLFVVTLFVESNPLQSPGGASLQRKLSVSAGHCKAPCLVGGKLHVRQALLGRKRETLSPPRSLPRKEVTSGSVVP